MPIPLSAPVIINEVCSADSLWDMLVSCKEAGLKNLSHLRPNYLQKIKGNYADRSSSYVKYTIKFRDSEMRPWVFTFKKWCYKSTIYVLQLSLRVHFLSQLVSHPPLTSKCTILINLPLKKTILLNDWKHNSYTANREKGQRYIHFMLNI